VLNSSFSLFWLSLDYHCFQLYHITRPSTNYKLCHHSVLFRFDKFLTVKFIRPEILEIFFLVNESLPKEIWHKQTLGLRDIAVVGLFQTSILAGGLTAPRWSFLLFDWSQLSSLAYLQTTHGYLKKQLLLIIAVVEIFFFFNQWYKQ